MKIQTKDFTIYSDLDYIDDWGNPVFVNKMMIPIEIIENWMDIYCEIATRILGFDFVTVQNNTIQLKKKLNITLNYLLGDFEYAIGKVDDFISDVQDSDFISIDGINYEISNDYFVVEIVLNKAEK